MKVPFLDLTQQYAQYRDDVLGRLHAVCEAQQFILGANVREAEARIAEYCGCRHAVGMSSGTDALLAALMAFDVGPGDDVITTPYTFFATAGTVARLGATPVFCDIDAASFNLSATQLEALLDETARERDGQWVNTRTGHRLRGLIPVDLYGQTADAARLRALAERYGLFVIEDAAQALGARDDAGRPAGALGDIGCLSFFPTKNLGAFGDAGMCLTDDDALADKLRHLRMHGMHPKYYHAMIGGNFRLDELQAAAINAKLAHTDGWIAKRRANAERYDRALAALGNVVTGPARCHGWHSFNQYVILAERRDALRQHLGERGVGTEIYYPLALHEQQCFAHLGYRAEEFPVSCHAARHSLALPIFPELSAAQIDYVTEQIAAFYR